MNSLPFSEIFTELLVAIHNALAYCHKKYKNGEDLSETDPGLNRVFETFSKISFYRTSGLDAHLVKGLTLGEKKRKERKVYPRLSKLVVYSYLKAQATKKGERYQAEIIPSPLNILYHALTVPEEPQTASYAFVLCRSMLFYFLELHPKHPSIKRIAPKLTEFQEEDIMTSIGSFNNHIDIQLRWPASTQNHEKFNYRIHYLNGHILSLKGYTYLWFNSTADLLKFCSVPKDSDPLPKLAKIYSNAFPSKEQYFFRMSGYYTALPDASEINNWIFGIPIPLRGADLLFYGGLKKTANGGLVISVHGQPGVGKTSAALSLSAVLSPFNTKTLYLSLEESQEDLKNRLGSLIPEYLRSLSIYANNHYAKRYHKRNDYSLDWFTALKFSEKISLKDLTEILSELKQKVEQQVIHSVDSARGILPAICPFLLVIDNVNELFINDIHDSRGYKEIEAFINQCRDMGGLVMLVAAEDIPSRFRLDYLVDVAIHLKHEGLQSKFDKPVRIIQLIKTRHQVSRQGSHVFHLSNSRGFRISPQVPSQMDKREKIKIELPSKTDFIQTLNFISNNDKGYFYKPTLAVAANSQILIYGHGSSGKAGFALKLLLTPLMKQELIIKDDIEVNRKREATGNIIINHQKLSKVLVISFLYPEEYYHVLGDRLINQFAKNIVGYDKKKNILQVKAFYPGFLTPEDFVYKIVRILDEAQLEGEPFTGILFDGLHNVFLQFKNLQESHMIWPLLYSILYRYSLTVVTTFTNFSINQNYSANENDNSQQFQTPEDFMLLQQGQKPFLHGLVKAADYFFMLEEVVKGKEKAYWISIKSSIRTMPPTKKLRWDRENLTMEDAENDS